MGKYLAAMLLCVIIAVACSVKSGLRESTRNGGCVLKTDDHKLYDSAYAAIRLYGIDTLIALSDTSYVVEGFTSLQVFASENHSVYKNRIYYLKHGQWKTALYSLEVFDDNPTPDLAHYLTSSTFSSCDSINQETIIAHKLLQCKSPNDTARSVFTYVRTTLYVRGTKMDQNGIDAYGTPLHKSIYPIFSYCILDHSQYALLGSDLKRLRKRR